MLKISCIKCKAIYETEDPDPYLCVPCNEERLRIAAEIDKKFAGRIREPANNFEKLVETMSGEGKAVTKQSMNNGTATFFSGKDLMGW
mgnify:CR=1 FL=1